MGLHYQYNCYCGFQWLYNCYCALMQVFSACKGAIMGLRHLHNSVPHTKANSRAILFWLQSYLAFPLRLGLASKIRTSYWPPAMKIQNSKRTNSKPIAIAHRTVSRHLVHFCCWRAFLFLSSAEAFDEGRRVKFVSAILIYFFQLKRYFLHRKYVYLLLKVNIAGFHTRNFKRIYGKSQNSWITRDKLCNE